MKLFLKLTLCALLLAAPAFAQGALPGNLLTVGDVLRLAPKGSRAVADARSAVQDAAREQRTLENDPQAVPIEVRAARRAVEAAEDDLKVAVAQSRLEGFNLFAELVEAQAAVEAQEGTARVAEISARAMEARHEAGAATESELTGAQSELASAERSLEEARTGLQFARDSLEAFLGTGVVEVRPLRESQLPEGTPTEEELVASAGEANRRIRNAERALVDAREQLAAVDNAYSAAREIETARERVQNAEEAISDARDAVQLSLRQALANLDAARNRYENARASGRSAAESYRASQARFEAGTISRVALEEARLSLGSSEASLQSALHALFRAHLQLEMAVLE